MNIVFGIIIGLLILMALVVIHELGHFLLARKNGVKVNEFGIGFPPRAIAWVRNPKWQKGTKNGEKKWLRLPKSEWDKPQKTLIFSLNWLPIGGFCAMDGESDSDTRKGTFGAASFWGKTQILFGGVLMNWLAAFVILTVLAFVGMPQFINNQFYLGQDAEIIGGGVTVQEVMADSPAADAGLTTGDQITAVDGETIIYPDDITEYNSAHAGDTVTYTISRGDQTLEIPVQLNPADAEYALGVSMTYGQTFIRSTWSAPLVGLGTTIQLTGETFRGLGMIVWNLISGVASQFSPDAAIRESGQTALSTAGDSVSGPIGIIGVLFPAFASAGAANLAFLAALISVSLACMNVLPIPALDGGRWLLIAIYRLRHKTLDQATEEKIVSRAFMVLLLLIILISVLDVMRFF